MEVNTHSNGALERRDKNDRRQSTLPASKYPFYDNLGSLVTHDRRNAPDRRLNYIQVEWISDINLQIFK